MNHQQKSLKANNTIFIYTLRKRDTNTVLYVGQTKYIGRRMNEHRTSLRNRNMASIYVYMRENNLTFFKDVIICVEYEVFSREDAEKIESDLIKKYKNTVLNTVKYDTRKYNTDPRLIKVKNLDTNEIFWCVAACMEKYNISRYKLDKAIKNKIKIDGCLFEYLK